MCGIAGIYLRDPEAGVDIDSMLDTLLDEIAHRGGDATGFVALGESGVTEWQKAACDVKDFVRHRRRVPNGTRTLLAHTRWATQGLPAFVENNHPLKRGSFFVIHNGHVSNDHKLFELANRGRYGQVDSEAIPARFASFGKLAAAPKVMEEIEGAAAIAAVDEKHPADLVLARGYSSPLHVLVTKKHVLWGSTPQTVKAAYEAHIGRLSKRAKIESVPEGTVLHFKDGKLKRYGFAVNRPAPIKVTTPITLPWKEVGTQVSSTTKWDEDGRQDHLDCDACGDSILWSEMEYRYDPEEALTWQFCGDCNSLWEYDGKKALALEEWSEDLEVVNAAVLEED